MPELPTQWDRLSAEAWTDDWCDLADALGIDYAHLQGDDLNSRQLRKVVQAWANENGWERVEEAIRRRSA